MGAPAVSPLVRAPRGVHAADPLRQARHGHVRPCPRGDDPRGAHGRHPRDHGCRRKRAGGDHGRVGGRAARDAVRGGASRADDRCSSSRVRRSASAATTSGPGGRRPTTRRRSTTRCSRRAGDRASASSYLVPSVGDVEWGRAWMSRLQLHASTPGAWEAFARMAFEIDVRHVAPAVNVPTLIVHAVGDRICDLENARFLARTIPGARYVELPGEDHVPWFDPDATLAEIREFLTGQREAASPDRMLATVLFTDLVGSTEQAAELGDRRWRDLLEQHHTPSARELALYRRPRARHRRRRLLRHVRRPGARDPLRAGDRRVGARARPSRARRPPHRRGRAPGR